MVGRLRRLWQLGPRLGALLLQGGAAMKGGSASAGADPHAILGGAVEGDQPSAAQDVDGVAEQRFEEVGVSDAEGREGGVIDRDTAGQPAEGVVAAAQVVQTPRADDAGKGGIQPQGDEDTRVGGGMSGPPQARADAVIQQGKVQRLDVSPDAACGVVGLEEFLKSHGRQHLLAINTA